MDDKIKVETILIKQEPKESNTYVTSDGKRFSDVLVSSSAKKEAENWQRRIDARKIIKGLIQYGEWYLVHNLEEAKAVWHNYTYGDRRIGNVPDSFPAWMNPIEADIDRNNYWHASAVILEEGELKELFLQLNIDKYGKK